MADVTPSARFADLHDNEKPELSEMEKASGQLALTESQRSSAGYANSTAGLDHKQEISKAERKLVFKLDILILPLAMLLYLSAYLDRGNLGNAKLMGLLDDVLDGSDTKFSLALSSFFITYIVFSIPGTMLAKAYIPSRSIAAGALIWSIAATCQATVKNPAGLYVCRLFVGIGEALFGQAMALYFAYFYKKTELAKRVGLFIACGALAGAFSGLISYGVARINNPAITHWRVLFLIEELPSLVLAIVVFFFLPSRPETTRYLNEDERTLECTRLNAEALGDHNAGLDWAAVRRGFMSKRTWIAAVMYSAMNLGLSSVSSFLPTIIKNMGYSNANAQLYSVPPYAVTVGFMFLLTSFSDRKQTRGIPTAAVFLIGLIGWTILHTVNAKHGNQHARYFGCICVVVAGYSAIPLIIAWQSANCASESQRAVALGALNSIGQCLSIAATFLFPKTEGPAFSKGTYVNIAFQALGFVIAIGLTLWYRYENARRDKAEGGKPPKTERIDISEHYDRSVGFRYVA